MRQVPTAPAMSSRVTSAHAHTRSRRVPACRRHTEHGKVDPEPRAHDGHEWLYVLSGQMRLVLGDRDWVLGPGEIAEFDTQVPHWFGSTGQAPAERLSIFGRPGERMKDRTEED